MAILRDYHCSVHSYFEGWDAKCPIKGCSGEVSNVILQAPGLLSDKTKSTDKNIRGIAQDFGMTDLKSTRAGEHQTGFLTKDNKLTDAEFKHATGAIEEMKRQAMNHAAENGISTQAPEPEQRPGSAAIWGGDNRFSMQSVLSGRAVQSIKGESVGFRPQDAGNLTGPKAASYIKDHENLSVPKE
jgi:hypothetical protein